MTANRKSIRPANQRALRSGLSKPARMLRESASRKAQKPSGGAELSERMLSAKAEGRLVTLSANTGPDKSVPLEMFIDWGRSGLKEVDKELQPIEYNLDLPSGVLLNPGQVFRIHMALPKPASEYPPEAYFELYLRTKDIYWWLPLDGTTSNGLERAKWVTDRKKLSAPEEVAPKLEEETPEPIIPKASEVGESLRKAELEGRVVKLRGRNSNAKPLILDFNSEKTKLYGMPKGKENFRLYMVTRRTNLNPDEDFVVKLELECRVSELDELAYVKLTLPSGVYWHLSLRGLPQAELKRRLAEREAEKTAESQTLAGKPLEESTGNKKSKRRLGRRN